MSNNSRKAALLTGLKIHEKFKVSLILPADVSRADECQCYSEKFPMCFSEEAKMEQSEESATDLPSLTYHQHN